MRAWLVTALVVGCAVPVTLLAALPAESAPRSTGGHSSSHQSIAAPAGHKAIPVRLQKAAKQALLSKLVGPKTQRAAGPRIAHLDPSLQAEAAASQAVSIKVSIKGSPARLIAAVGRLHGSVDAVTSGAVSAVVPRTALATLAASAGVTDVTKPVMAFIEGTTCPSSTCSQGVADSGAATWQTGSPPDAGAGVTIGIVDAGFQGLAAQQAAGNLPQTGAGLTYSSTVAGGDRCANDQASPHGTAVAEIIHQMAPGANLVLECVDDSGDFMNAAAALESPSIVPAVKIVNSSLGFPGDSRGDGSGGVDSAAATVEQARKAGILWIQSAGNTGSDHWSGSFTPPNANGLVTLDSSGDVQDVVGVYPGGTASVVLQWDQWPVSSVSVALDTAGVQCNDANCTTTTAISSGQEIEQAPGTEPTLIVSLQNTSSFFQYWAVGIVDATGTPALHYDLSYWGDVTSNNLACTAPDANSATCYSPTAAAGSIVEPASSPYAFAVGAADGSGDTVDVNGACDSDVNVPGTTYPAESFSSEGPTIDGRTKPDILAFDGVNSNIAGLSPFCGTSAAAPHVAGAAALVLAANPAMDASQLEAFLEQRANSGGPLNPPSDQEGHGVLSLGAQSGIAPPAGSTYTALPSPVRALDTRKTPGATLAAGHSVSISIATAVPAVPDDATAVAINLTGVGATNWTYLSAYAGGTFPGTSNLNLTTADATAASFAVVTLGPLPHHAITVKNGGAATVDVLVDVLGYFSPATSNDSPPATKLKYTPVTPTRLLDTRTPTGGHPGLVTSGKTITVATGEPAGTSIVVNVTAAGEQGSGWLHLDASTPHQPIATSTLNYLGYDRANLAIVAVGASGTFTVTGGGSGAADVIVDLVGTFTVGGSSTFVPLPAPVRMVDTRNGNGGRLGSLGTATTMSLFGSGVGEIPHSATALLTGVVAVSNTTQGYFTIYPGGASKPGTSSLNFSGQRTVANAAIAGLGGQSVNIYNYVASANAVVDVFGYFD
jgi:hypothetical protein